MGSVITELLRGVELNPEELEYLASWLERTKLDEENLRAQELKAWQFKLDSLRTRLQRLTDLLIDGTIEKELFDQRKNALLLDEREAKDHILDIEKNGGKLPLLEKFLGLVKNPVKLYETANSEEKREIIKELTSDLKVSGKNVMIEPKNSVQLLLERSKDSGCSPHRGVPRTFGQLLSKLLACCEQVSEGEKVTVPTFPIQSY